MRLDRILKIASWEETEICFRRDYCGEWRLANQDDDEVVRSHKHVYRQLCKLRPEPNDCVINIDADIEGETIDFNVWCRKPGDDTAPALPFVRWEEWLGMEVAAETLQRFSASAIIAHCLWKMSTLGYEQGEIGEAFEDLITSVQEVGVSDGPWSVVRRKRAGDTNDDGTE